MVNVVIIEDAPALNYLTQGAADKLLRRRARHLTRVKTSHLQVTHEGEPAQFSLDGEMIDTTDLTVDSLPGAMRFCVGAGYDPSPVEWSSETPERVDT
jgi:diacylglycerol kinase family enzyme